jgi:hypothetical protein
MATYVILGKSAHQVMEKTNFALEREDLVGKAAASFVIGIGATIYVLVAGVLMPWYLVATIIPVTVVAGTIALTALQFTASLTVLAATSIYARSKALLGNLLPNHAAAAA